VASKRVLASEAELARLADQMLQESVEAFAHRAYGATADDERARGRALEELRAAVERRIAEVLRQAESG